MGKKWLTQHEVCACQWSRGLRVRCIFLYDSEVLPYITLMSKAVINAVECSKEIEETIRDLKYPLKHKLS